MVDLKTSAELRRRQLRYGQTTLKQVQQWADEEIVRMDRPPSWLIDVSMSESVDRAASALLEAPGEPDENVIWWGQ